MRMRSSPHRLQISAIQTVMLCHRSYTGITTSHLQRELQLCLAEDTSEVIINPHSSIVNTLSVVNWKGNETWNEIWYTILSKSTGTARPITLFAFTEEIWVSCQKHDWQNNMLNKSRTWAFISVFFLDIYLCPQMCAWQCYVVRFSHSFWNWQTLMTNKDEYKISFNKCIY